MKNIQLLTLIGAAFAGTIFTASPAQAVVFAYNPVNSGAGVFSYDITLAAGEDFDLLDSLALEGLGGITAVDSDENTELQFNNFFDSISANFSVSDDASGPGTFENAIILSSNNPLGTIDYSANSSLGAFSGSAQGPVAVPFEPSANLGIFILLGLGGLNSYRKRWHWFRWMGNVKQLPLLG